MSTQTKITDKQAQYHLLQAEMLNDDAALVSAISCMSDLLVGSLSSLKATMTNSFTEIQNTLAQFAAEGEEELADLEALHDGQSSRKRPRIESVGLSQQTGTIERNEPLTAVPQRDIDELINQNSQNSGEETPITSAPNDTQVLSGIENDLKLEQNRPLQRFISSLPK